VADRRKRHGALDGRSLDLAGNAHLPIAPGARESNLNMLVKIRGGSVSAAMRQIDVVGVEPLVALRIE
jgi:hypothetical protein